VARFTSVAPHSRILATFDEDAASALLSAEGGGAAAIETTVGSHGGRIVQLGWLPGLSYLVNATQEYYVPDARTQFPAAIRDFLRDLVAGEESSPPTLIVATSPQSKDVLIGIETVLLASSAGAVATVVSWIDDSSTKDLPMSLRINITAAGFASAAEIGKVFEAATGKSLTLQSAEPGCIAVTLNRREHANFVVLRKKRQQHV
jgi:hypothetical protein